MIFSVLYLDVDNFKAYSDAYGFSHGDRAIKLIADILMDNVRHLAPGMIYRAHRRDDFVVITDRAWMLVKI